MATTFASALLPRLKTRRDAGCGFIPADDGDRP
jgi:hypothetical protein